MKLLIDFLGWFTRKALVVIVLVCTLTICYFAWDLLLPQMQKILDVPQKIEELTQNRDKIRLEIDALQAKINEREQNRPPIYRPWKRYSYDKETELLQLGLQIDTLKAEEQNAARKIASILNSQDAKFSHYVTMLSAAFLENLFRIVWIILLVLLVPSLWKFLWYYGFAAFTHKAHPLQITPVGTHGMIELSPSNKQMNVTIDSQHPLYIRMKYLNQYDRNSIIKETQLLWKWSSPFISYSAGLCELTKVSAKDNISFGNVVLSSGDPDMYLREIKLIDHPGLVIHPKHVIGVSGKISVKARWFIEYLHSWLTGQFRYVIFYGTGSIYLEGKGGIDGVEVNSGIVSVEEPFVVGFDTRLTYATNRTETFWPYYRDQCALIDDQFCGQGYFFRQVSAQRIPTTFAEKNLNILMNMGSVIGKFFGF